MIKHKAGLDFQEKTLGPAAPKFSQSLSHQQKHSSEKHENLAASEKNLVALENPGVATWNSAKNVHEDIIWLEFAVSKLGESGPTTMLTTLACLLPKGDK